MPADPNVKVGTGAIVRRSGGRILMMQRQGADGEGTWSVAGGWLEFGETAEEAAAREVLEETGLTVKPLETAGVINFASDDGKTWVVDLFVECAWIGGEPRVTEPDKCLSVGWQSERNLPAPLYEPFRQWAAAHLNHRKEER